MEDYPYLWFCMKFVYLFLVFCSDMEFFQDFHTYVTMCIYIYTYPRYMCTYMCIYIHTYIYLYLYLDIVMYVYIHSGMEIELVALVNIALESEVKG